MNEPNDKRPGEKRLVFDPDNGRVFYSDFPALQPPEGPLHAHDILEPGNHQDFYRVVGVALGRAGEFVEGECRFGGRMAQVRARAEESSPSTGPTSTGTLQAVAWTRRVHVFIRHASPWNADLETLQGSWKQTRCEKDGKPDPADEKGWEPTTLISGDAFTVILADGSIPIKGTFKLDPAREPKELEFTDTFGDDAGKTFPGIYTLTEDRFIFCVSDHGRERPKVFAAGPGQVLRDSRRIA